VSKLSAKVFSKVNYSLSSEARNINHVSQLNTPNDAVYRCSEEKKPAYLHFSINVI